MSLGSTCRREDILFKRCGSLSSARDNISKRLEQAPESWLQHVYGNNKALRSWPHYAVLVDEGDDTGSHLTYVVQEQLELMKNTEVQHSQMKDSFEYFDGAQYIPRKRLRILYPKD